MKEISAKLKEARSKKGLSIAEVSVATKINAKILQAIEDADINHLPAKPFLRGFIQTYSRYLELNVDEVMNRFAEEIGTTKPKIQQAGDLTLSSTESHDESQRKIELYKKIGMVASAIIGALLIWGIFKIIGKYEAENKAAREQRQEVLKAESPVTEIVPVADAEATPATTTLAPTTTADIIKPETTPVITPVEVKPVIEAKQVAAVPAPVVPIAKVVIPVETKLAPIKIDVPVKPVVAQVPDVKPLPTPEIKPVVDEKVKAARPQELILEALDNVEIRYQKDGESEKSTKLQPEKVLLIRAKEKISLTISDGGAINVIYNGKDKGVPGSLGQSVKLSYP